MAQRYSIENPNEIPSPGLVVFKEIVCENIRRMQAIAGEDRRLRPHCKTHKMIEVTRMQVEMGIFKHKCATFAEAEMLALGGARDVFLAYNLVGPNIANAVSYRRRFPAVRFSVTADHPVPVADLNAAMAAAGEEIHVMVDIDTGLRRTGLPPGPEASDLYALINDSSHLIPAGLHLYDGQNHQTDLHERQRAVDQCWEAVMALRGQLAKSSLAVPSIVAGGTGTFPLYARKDEPSLELSPGTCVFHDDGYAREFPDIRFEAAALILTRVISRPAGNLVTFDLGYKACASDPPAGSRLRFPGIPDAREVLQNEEHLVIETGQAACYRPGDVEMAIPVHICPTSALYSHAWVVVDGRVRTRWEVTARDGKHLRSTPRMGIEALLLDRSQLFPIN